MVNDRRSPRADPRGGADPARARPVERCGPDDPLDRVIPFSSVIVLGVVVAVEDRYGVRVTRQMLARALEGGATLNRLAAMIDGAARQHAGGRLMWLSVVRAPAPRPGLLTRTERAEVERLRYRGRRRDEWIAGRLAARRVLARRLGAGVRDVSVVADPAGAPRVTGGPAPLAISLSHDGGRVAVALAPGRGRVAVDVCDRAHADRLPAILGPAWRRRRARRRLRGLAALECALKLRGLGVTALLGAPLAIAATGARRFARVGARRGRGVPGGLARGLRARLGRGGRVSFIASTAIAADPAAAEATHPELWRQARRFNLPVKLALTAAHDVAAQARAPAEARLVSLSPCHAGSPELWRATHAFETNLAETGKAARVRVNPTYTLHAIDNLALSALAIDLQNHAPCLGLGGAAGQAWSALEWILERPGDGETLLFAGDQSATGTAALGVAALFRASRATARRSAWSPSSAPRSGVSPPPGRPGPTRRPGSGAGSRRCRPSRHTSGARLPIPFRPPTATAAIGSWSSRRCDDGAGEPARGGDRLRRAVAARHDGGGSRRRRRGRALRHPPRPARGADGPAGDDGAARSKACRSTPPGASSR